MGFKNLEHLPQEYALESVYGSGTGALLIAMEQVVHIAKNGVDYALVFPRTLPTENGLRFPTHDNDGLQVGFFERDKGYEVPPHRHLPRKIDLEHIAEFIAIEKGRVAITVYDEEWNVVGEQEVKTGECIIFLRGGHALQMLEPTRIMEVKQGPYPGKSNDKILKDAS